MTKLQRQSLIKGALMAAASKGTARFLRFLLLTVIAYKFGRNFETDAYFIVQSLTVLFLTVNDTIFNFSLIPVLVDERVKNGDEEARELAGSAFAYLNLFFFVVSLGFFIFAAPLARLMGPGLSPESQELAAVIIRIISPIITFTHLKFFTLHTDQFPARGRGKGSAKRFLHLYFRQVYIARILHIQLEGHHIPLLRIQPRPFTDPLVDHQAWLQAEFDRRTVICSFRTGTRSILIGTRWISTTVTEIRDLIGSIDATAICRSLVAKLLIDSCSRPDR